MVAVLRRFTRTRVVQSGLSRPRLDPYTSRSARAACLTIASPAVYAICRVMGSHGVHSSAGMARLRERIPKGTW